MNTTPTHLSVFEGQHIRRVWHENEWYFSVIDVVGTLTDSVDAKDYWYRMASSYRHFVDN